MPMKSKTAIKCAIDIATLIPKTPKTAIKTATKMKLIAILVNINTYEPRAYRMIKA